MSNNKILVVEDDADVRLGYHVLLKANHYETFLAIDGVSAVSEALKCQPDLIILDLGLPAGNGFKVLEWFRANTYLALIPVIVVSARDLNGSKERALRAGAKAYLQKPWNDDELLATIRQLLDEPVPSIAQPVRIPALPVA
jgi:chemosensory pili system protein ChpA (sensor histidine kinase/response regulator)